MTPIAKQLADAKHNGVHRLVRRPEEIVRAAGEAGLAAFRIDLGGVRDKKGFLGHVAKALSFPAWFGGNWDALNDCLTDLSWLPATTGYVLLFENVEKFREFEDATAVLGAAAEYWKNQGRPFSAFIAESQE
jgi:RNAse (barnase) inhibitor barstar